ncbi:hypothetical protein F4778DRAFT_462331 [Xylariomycetidae sp. FL2044]|nr:hypothetical protein F4778DRAFT_462331 [Xylariomycetidae sp. FL2044]
MSLSLSFLLSTLARTEALPERNNTSVSLATTVICCRYEYWESVGVAMGEGESWMVDGGWWTMDKRRTEGEGEQRVVWRRRMWKA